MSRIVTGVTSDVGVPSTYLVITMISTHIEGILPKGPYLPCVSMAVRVLLAGCPRNSRIPLSRAPLTRENQLVALAPWTPNFSDAPPATAHMTDRVTHMCWCQQISPLAHSPQATWQPFNLSYCIEMHNTHLLGRAVQLSQVYFTHSAPILTPRNLPLTVNKQWPPLRISRMSRHTRFNTSRKTATAAMNGIFLGTNAVDRSIRPSIRIRFGISIVSKMSKS